MRILAISFFIISFVYGILIMRKQATVTKKSWFNELNSEEKRSITAVVKASWKVSIMLLAINMASALIVVSTFLGDGNKHEGAISILGLITSIIVFMSLFINDNRKNTYFKKMEK